MAENFCWKISKSVLTNTGIVLVFLLTVIFSPILVLFALPLYLWRAFISLLSKCFGKGVEKLVAARSAIFASDPIYTQPLMTNVARFIFDGKIELRTMEKLIDKNWVQARCPKTNKLKYPELKQYITIWMGYYFWRSDESFNVKNHVKLYFNQRPGNFISASEVNDAWNEMSMTPFEKNRSPWEVILIPFYREHRHWGDEPIKSVMIFRWHHALSDGFSILNLLSSIADVNLNTMARMNTKKRLCCAGMGKKLGLFFTTPFWLINLLTTRKDKNSWHLPEKQMTHYWHLGVGTNLPIQIVHDLKANFSVSFACVLLAAITGSMRKLMVKEFEGNSSKVVPKNISCGVPFPLPDHPDKLRNHWAICTVRLPVGEANPVSRLQIIDRNLKRMKKSSKPLVAYVVAPWIGSLPACLIKSLVTNDVTTIVSSIMPGPSEEIKNFMGHSVRDASYIIGCGPGRNGFSFSVLSYNGNIKFALTLDSALAPNERTAKDLIVYVEEEMDFLKKICIQDNSEV